MLQELISHSLYCHQQIKYDCYKAPLDLHSATWFISSNNNNTVDYIGDVKRGSCPCASKSQKNISPERSKRPLSNLFFLPENKTCINPVHSCNCDDISEAKWHTDEGLYTNQTSLGITEMVFLQQSNLAPDALGRITLGPLECVETSKYLKMTLGS